MDFFISRFFDYVDETRFEETSYRLFINLLDNYNHRTGQREPELTATERAETEEYLDFLISTPVINELINFLISKGILLNFMSLQTCQALVLHILLGSMCWRGFSWKYVTI